jgi:hypothetical protein
MSLYFFIFATARVKDPPPLVMFGHRQCYWPVPAAQAAGDQRDFIDESLEFNSLDITMVKDYHLNSPEGSTHPGA